MFPYIVFRGLNKRDIFKSKIIIINLVTTHFSPTTTQLNILYLILLKFTGLCIYIFHRTLTFLIHYQLAALTHTNTHHLMPNLANCRIKLLSHNFAIPAHYALNLLHIVSQAPISGIGSNGSLMQ